MNKLEKLLEIDLEKESNRIIKFIREIITETKSNGIVVGISGGVDSALVTVLCVKAIGPEKVFGVMLPLDFTPKQDLDDAIALAKQLNIQFQILPIDSIAKSFFENLNLNMNDPSYKLAMANIRARIRMIILYYFANLKNALVVGTGDKSEILIGFFTKYGDGGVDFLPIAHLYKTQVRKMAEFLGVPSHIAYKPASPQLYPGHLATDEIPIGYEKMDPVLVGLVDKKMKPDKVSKITDVSIEIINKIISKIKNSEHKRKYPKMI